MNLCADLGREKKVTDSAFATNYLLLLSELPF